MGTLSGGCASGSVGNTRCGPGRKCASRSCGCRLNTASRALVDVRRAFRGRKHDLVREPDAGDLHVRFDERRLETESRRGVRHRHRRKSPGTVTPCAYHHRASRRLYLTCRIRSGGCMPGLKQVGLQIAHCGRCLRPRRRVVRVLRVTAAGSLSLRPAFRPIVLHPVRDRLLCLG